MTMMHSTAGRLRSSFHALAVVALSIGVAGCRDNPATSGPGAGDDRVDATGQAARDPAMRAALEDQIMVDPKLVAQSNRNAVTPGNAPIDGAVPAVVNSRAARDAEAAAAAALQAGGGMMRAPAPVAASEAGCTDCAANRPVTLGAKAEQQGLAKRGGCDARLTYGNEWARRMPAAFPLYPQAMVREAAGVDGGVCDIRVVNFQTAASLQSVVDYYYTLARRAGYPAEHRLVDGEHQLGGVRGEQAFVVMARRDGALTDVDIVASGGR